MTLLEVKDLHTHFNTYQGVARAVDGVSFDVGEGEMLGLVGESGCGKSVTALSIMNLVPEPSGRIVSGEINFDGKNLVTSSQEELRSIRGRSVAMVFQDPMTSLNPVMTVGQQISEGVRLHLGMSRQEARRRAVELLQLVGIPDAERRCDSYPHEFSGGMRQRVMIAMAVSCNPRLILADEVTTALDVTIQAQILELLKSLAAEFNTAVLVITHDLGVIARMTQRVHVMYAGQIVERATTPEFFRNPRMPYVWGLLASLPRLDEPRKTRLVPIQGLPPDLMTRPPGCRFAPRCPHARDICHARPPDLLRAAGADAGHEVRCWATQDVPGGGWLREVDWRTAATVSIGAAHGDRDPGRSVPPPRSRIPTTVAKPAGAPHAENEVTE